MGKNRNAVATREQGGTLMVGQTQLPAYLEGFKGPTGSEDISNDDVSIPRLMLGQGMSAAVKEGSVGIGDMFLNINQAVLNEDGDKLPFVVLGYAKEYILWRPKADNGGGILARAKPVQTPDGVRYKWDQANTSFNVKVGGLVDVVWRTGEYVDDLTVPSDGGKISLNDWGSEIPGKKDSKKAVTEHHNYVIALPTHNRMICALSLSKTSTPVAKKFNADLKLGTAPRAARIYTVEAVDDKRGANDFKNYKFRAAGYVVEQDEFNFYRDLETGFKKKGINVDQRDAGDEPDEAADERA